ncbi:MAG: enoyl-CoA hydratase/isomerase family protein, partial [Candidatus Poseidoniaceae archaeon]|nr:enoyl-CoA hydratase/isomerase family protein [Candidatus Poseidoniaceae archaeon]
MSAAPQSDVVAIETIVIDDENPNNGVVAKVIVNRPDKLNALNSDVVTSLIQVCEWAENDDDVRVVVFAGQGPNPPAEGKRAKPNAFIAGADITEFVGVDSTTIHERFSNNAWEAIWALSMPTIAMVDGFALGGGCEVAMSCDIRIGSQRAKFGTPEINLGLIPGGGGTQRLPRLVGYGRAMEMVLSGEMIDADEAYRIGLLNRLTSDDELEAETIELAKNIGAKSPHTLKVAKQAVRTSLE